MNFYTFLTFLITLSTTSNALNVATPRASPRSVAKHENLERTDTKTLKLPLTDYLVCISPPYNSNYAF
jgi:hypothetical protein